jgi:hypothetical protein
MSTLRTVLKTMASVKSTPPIFTSKADGETEGETLGDAEGEIDGDRDGDIEGLVLAIRFESRV